MSKLRENDKVVIGVGVKNSTSDLLVTNCDEFIFYDDLVRESKRAAKKAPRAKAKQAKAQAEAAAPAPPRKYDDERRAEAIDLIVETVDALARERGGDEKIWGSMVKQALKRRNPGFNESYYGFRTFSDLLEEAQNRKLLTLEPDQKSGGYVIKKAANS